MWLIHLEQLCQRNLWANCQSSKSLQQLWQNNEPWQASTRPKHHVVAGCRVIVPYSVCENTSTYVCWWPSLCSFDFLTVHHWVYPLQVFFRQHWHLPVRRSSEDWSLSFRFWPKDSWPCQPLLNNLWPSTCGFLSSVVKKSLQETALFYALRAACNCKSKIHFLTLFYCVGFCPFKKLTSKKTYHKETDNQPQR